MDLYRLFGVAVALVPTIASGDEIPGSRFYSGNWEGAAYWDSDVTGEFSHCSISAYYPGHDASLMFFLSKDYTMSLGVVAETPIFAGVDDFAVVARVDRRAPIYGTARVAEGDDMAFLEFPDLEIAIDKMKRGHILVLESEFGSFPFSLEGTYRALDAAYDCAGTYYSYRASPGSPEAATTAQATWTPTPGQTALMYQIATKMISDAGQTDFEYLAADKLVELGVEKLANGVAWIANDGGFFGAVVVGRLVGPEIDLQAENAADMASLASECKGDTASINRNYDVEGFPTSELVSMCSYSEGTTETTLMKMTIDGVSVETITMVSRPNKPAEGTAPVASISAEKAAATAVSFVKP